MKRKRDTESHEKSFIPALFQNPNPKFIKSSNFILFRPPSPLLGLQENILIVGDGDFSFSLSLAAQIGGKSIITSSYDSKATLISKYGRSVEQTIQSLTESGAKVLFDIDATDADSLFSTMKSSEERFNRIVFNFPHIGGATERDKDANQKLLRNFLISIDKAKILKQGSGKVFITLRQTEFYLSWNIPELLLSSDCPKFVRENLKYQMTVPFPVEKFPSYKPVRTHPAKREAPSAEDSVIYIFQSLEKEINVKKLKPDDQDLSCSDSDDGIEKDEDINKLKQSGYFSQLSLWKFNFSKTGKIPKQFKGICKRLKISKKNAVALLKKT